MEKYAVDINDDVERRAQEMVKMGSLDLTEARFASQKEIENGSRKVVELRPGKGTGSNS
jgi:hypothetical protein